MKKLLLLLFCMCMICTLNVKAETSSDSQYTYTVDGYVKYTNSEYITDTFALEYQSNCPLAAYIYYYKKGDFESHTIYFIKKLSDGTFHSANYFSMINVTSVKNSSIREVYSDSSRKELIRKNNIDIIDYDSLKTYEEHELHFSMPLFESREDAESYLNGEKSEKDALNYETDLCKVVYDLEIPQDLKITGFSGDEFNFDYAKIEDINYKFKWSQTNPEHSKWTTQFYCYEDFKYRLEGFFTSIGEWMYKEDYYLFYDDTDTYRCYWNDYFKKLAEGYVKKEESFGDYDYEILCTKVFIRNAWYDSDEGIQHYSNWIKVDIDFTSGEITTSFIELGGSEVEKDESTGNLVIPEDNIIVDSDYTGSDYNGLMIQSSTDLVGWIKNGFGLTGENGVIVLMSETFSFIPPDLWYVFLTGISMFVLIAVVKWVRG